MQDQALWDQIWVYDFDASPLGGSFSHELAHRTGWTRDYAAKVVDEYRRFLYLVAISEGELSPSRMVDEAWHLHLEDDADFSGRLCGETIGKPIRHNRAESFGDEARLEAQYLRSLALYRREFGQVPPTSIWRTARHHALWKYGGLASWVGIALIVISGAAAVFGDIPIMLAGFGGILVASGLVLQSRFAPPPKEPGLSYGGGACGGAGCGG